MDDNYDNNIQYTIIDGGIRDDSGPDQYHKPLYRSVWTTTFNFRLVPSLSHIAKRCDTAEKR